jgi:hypothetical protein
MEAPEVWGVGCLPDYTENYWNAARNRRDEFSGEWDLKYARTLLRVGAGRRNIAALAVLTTLGLIIKTPDYYFALTLPSLLPGLGIVVVAALIVCYAASFKFIFPFWLAAALFFIDSLFFFFNSVFLDFNFIAANLSREFYMKAIFRLGVVFFLIAGALWAVKLKRLKKGL